MHTFLKFNNVLICRWRDVKLCSFEDADHRTYVDLKVRILFSFPYEIDTIISKDWM